MFAATFLQKGGLNQVTSHLLFVCPWIITIIIISSSIILIIMIIILINIAVKIIILILIIPIILLYIYTHGQVVWFYCSIFRYLSWNCENSLLTVKDYFFLCQETRAKTTAPVCFENRFRTFSKLTTVDISKSAKNNYSL